jgi:nicotinate-nucleotide adenylyltransferase
MAPLIGLFGGTFDPPHVGHLILAAEAHFQLGLDRLLWILTPNPPHKKIQPITPIKHRLAMVRLALADATTFEFSTIDMDRPGPHYALDTVNIITTQFPGADLVYLMGGDSLRDLPTWYRPEELVAELNFIGVMRRPGDLIDLLSLEKKVPGITAKVHFMDAPLLDIAAHDIRIRVAEGRPFRYYLPVKVYDYIKDHSLYQSAHSQYGS